MNSRPQGPIAIAVGLLFSLSACLGNQEPKSPGPGVTPAKEPLPKIPAKDLPLATRTRPDPEKSQYVRESVYVSIQEQVKSQAGDVSQPRIRVVEDYLKEYLRRAGHPIAADLKGAHFGMEGSIDLGFVSTVKVLDRVAGYKYRGSAKVRLLSATGAELETYSLPDLLEENVKSEESTVLNLRRRMAKLLWDQITLQGKVLSNAEVMQLLGSLAIQPGDGETQTTEDVVGRLSEIGFPAVPYLLESLTDNRIVRIASRYPGLKGRNLDDLRVFHVADKALEEIFQKVSRMSLDIAPEDSASQKLRLVITKGWENEWRRFCKPYAESPNAPRAKPVPASAKAPEPKGQ